MSSVPPVKTAEGLAELSERKRRLSQRHRTVLLLVDGKRSVEQVLHLAAQAGVPAECFEELVLLGLIERFEVPPVPAPETVFAATEPLAPPREPAIGPDAPVSAGDDSWLPPVGELPAESSWSGEANELAGPDADEDDFEPAVRADGALVDRPLEEARELLLRALRNEAPVTGSITILKLKRAGTRDEVEALLDEVEQRIRKPRRQIIAAQTMRHVRHLLSLPPTTSPA